MLERPIVGQTMERDYPVDLHHRDRLVKDNSSHVTEELSHCTCVFTATGVFVHVALLKITVVM